MNKKLYSESMRRLLPVGMTLMIIAVALTAILCVNNANATLLMEQLDNPFNLMPVLPYYAFVAGIGLAYMGFGFLNKRCDSDFYHSIPVRRQDIFTSVTLAAATWIGATVVLCVLASMVVYLFMGVPFVLSYYLLGIPFFIVAAMLAYAAAAIGCSLTGTLLSNVILTGIILFLPRFILFWLARSIVATTYIVGWQDLAGLLNPCTNVATGMVVMLSRSMLKGNIVAIGNIVYSLILMLIELALGALLFIKRPSELAERSAKSSRLQTLFACLLVLPIMLLFMRSPRLQTVVIVFVVSLAVYLVYQFIVLRTPKRVFASLLWYACTLVVAAGLYFGMTGVSNAVLNETPQAAQIKSVRFVRNEQGYYMQPNYSTVLVSKIDFTNDAVKQCAADALSAAVERIKTPEYDGQRVYLNGYNSSNIESVVLTLNNGKKIRRSIEFLDMNALNAARSENAEYVEAIHAYPALEEISFLSGRYKNNKKMTEEDVEKLRASFVAEYTSLHQVGNTYYDERTYEILGVSSADRWRYPANEGQSFGSFQLSGNVGQKRFRDYYGVTLTIPKTAGLYMMLSNNNVEADVVHNAQATLKILEDEKPQNGYIYFRCSTTNVPMQDGSKQQIPISFSCNVVNGEIEVSPYDNSMDIALAQEVLAMLSRGTLTANPNTLFATFNFDSNIRFNGDIGQDSTSYYSGYLAFTKEDEKRLLQIIDECNQREMERQRVYDPGYTAAGVVVG